MKKVVAVVASCLPALALQAAPAPKWNHQTLGNLGAGGTIAYGVNNRGEIVGRGHTATGAIHGFHWENGVITDAGEWFPRFGSALYAINDQGLAVGTGNGTEVVFWKDGVWTSPNVAEGTPVDINKFGDIAGTRWIGRTVGYSYINGVMTQYAPADLSLNAGVNALNDRGVVAGWTTIVWGVRHAFLGKDGVMTDLGTFGGNMSTAYDVNNHGVAVGVAADATGQTKGFVYDGTMQPVCGLGYGSEPLAINDRGAIVGHSPDLKGFLCQDGVLTSLVDIPEVYAAGWRQMFPQDINERGWIVGWGFKVGGSPNGEAFVLTPK